MLRNMRPLLSRLCRMSHHHASVLDVSWAELLPRISRLTIKQDPQPRARRSERFPERAVLLAASVTEIFDLLCKIIGLHLLDSRQVPVDHNGIESWEVQTVYEVDEQARSAGYGAEDAE